MVLEFSFQFLHIHCWCTETQCIFLNVHFVSCNLADSLISSSSFCFVICFGFFCRLLGNFYVDHHGHLQIRTISFLPFQLLCLLVPFIVIARARTFRIMLLSRLIPLWLEDKLFETAYCTVLSVICMANVFSLTPPCGRELCGKSPYHAHCVVLSSSDSSCLCTGCVPLS